MEQVVLDLYTNINLKVFDNTIPNFDLVKTQLYSLFADNYKEVYNLVNYIYLTRRYSGEKILTDPLDKFKWISKNVPYFSKAGKAIRHMRNALVHHNLIGKDLLFSCVKSLVQFSLRMSKEEYEEISYLLAPIFTKLYIIGKVIFTGEKSNMVCNNCNNLLFCSESKRSESKQVEPTIESEENPNIKRAIYFKDEDIELKGKRIRMIKGPREGLVFRFICWNGNNFYMRDENTLVKYNTSGCAYIELL